MHFIQLLHDEIGTDPPEQPGGRHNFIVAMYCATWWIRGYGEMACTATEGNTSWPNTSRITSEDIRLRDVMNCPNTWRLDIISPASCCSRRAAITASSRSIVQTQCPGDRVNRCADSGAPTYSRNRGWWSCNPYAGSTSTTSALSYDVIRYGQPGKLFNTMGTSPTSDALGSTSNGPSRDKSAGTKSNGVSVSAGDDPSTGRGGRMQSHGSGNSGSGSRGRSESPSINELSPASRLSIDAGPPVIHSLSPQAGLESPVK